MYDFALALSIIFPAGTGSGFLYNEHLYFFAKILSPILTELKVGTLTTLKAEPQRQQDCNSISSLNLRKPTHKAQSSGLLKTTKVEFTKVLLFKKLNQRY